MKTIFYSIIAFIGICVMANGQSFEVTSKTNFVIDAKVDSSDLYKDFKVNSIFKNTSTNAEDINFVWEAIIATPLPNKWVLTLCDPTNCLVLKQTPTSTFSVAINSTKLSIMDVGAITSGVPGSVTVKVKIYPKGKPDLSKTFDYKINVESPTGVDLNEVVLSTYSLYPNPCANIINISTTGFDDKGAQVNVLDILGSKVKDFGKIQGNGSVQSMDISELAAGVYTLVITSSTGKNYSRLFTKN